MVRFISSPSRMEHISAPLTISSPSLTSSVAIVPSHGASTIRFSRRSFASSSDLLAVSRCRRRFSSLSVIGESVSLKSVSPRLTVLPTSVRTLSIVPP